MCELRLKLVYLCTDIFICRGRERLVLGNISKGQLESRIGSSRKPASRVLTYGGMKLHKGKQSIGSLKERKRVESDWGSQEQIDQGRKG